ncbi:YtxH domain-containing protein [Heyndrickxia sp. NPDC080065]|uniref:YtxH domain-containing protein n=1 Tax=Heyndrickxia sp. NPDC080065 TaxID=3390568 RepID=UPI003CFF9516
MANKNETKQMDNQEQLNRKDFIAGALIGGIVGAVTALLLAPKSGKELRNDLSGQVEALKGKTDHLRIAVTQKGNELASATKDKSILLKDFAVEKGNQLVGSIKDKSKVENKVEEDTYEEEFI